MRGEANRKRGTNREQKEANTDALRPCETIQLSPKVTDEVGTQKASAYADYFASLTLTSHPPSLTLRHLPLKGKAFFFCKV